MATPKIIADFETQLSSAISIGDTTFTIASAADDDDVALPSGLYYFTIENGSTNKEYLAGTLSGTTVSSVVSVSRQGTETSGAARAHRVGSSVIISDFLTYKKYMDEIALVSAPDADTNTKGVLEAATLAEVRARTASGGSGANLAVTPNVLDDLPTQDEKAALAAIGSNAPDSGNKYVTQDDLSDPTFKAPQVVTFTSSGTWTKDANLKYVVVEVIGGGGAGGGMSNVGRGGGGGGAGGFSRKTILSSALGSTETVTIGAGGTGVSGSTGNNGSTTSFGAHCSATGGTGGEGGAGATPGTGGTGASGDFNISGQGGGSGSVSLGIAGSGGNSHFGGGGPGQDSTGNGVAGTSGGGGGGAVSGGSAQTGGNGGNGIVVVTEYYS